MRKIKNYEKKKLTTKECSFDRPAHYHVHSGYTHLVNLRSNHSTRSPAKCCAVHCCFLKCQTRDCLGKQRITHELGGAYIQYSGKFRTMLSAT